MFTDTLFIDSNREPQMMFENYITYLLVLIEYFPVLKFYAIGLLSNIIIEVLQLIYCIQFERKDNLNEFRKINSRIEWKLCQDHLSIFIISIEKDILTRLKKA